MHSFLMSVTNQHDIAVLDAKVRETFPSSAAHPSALPLSHIDTRDSGADQRHQASERVLPGIFRQPPGSV